MRQSKEQKFEKLYTEYKNTVFKTSIMYLKDYQLAEDAAQEVFYKVLKKLHTLKDESKAKSWILKITVNVCRDKLKHSSKREIPTEYVPEGSAARGDSDLKLTVAQAVGMLNDEQREVVVLYYYQQLRQREIAGLLGLPESTINYQLKLARKELKKYLQEDIYG